MLNKWKIYLLGGIILSSSFPAFVGWQKLKENIALDRILAEDEKIKQAMDEKRYQLNRLYEKKKKEEAEKVEKEIYQTFLNLAMKYERFLENYPLNKEAWNYLGLVYYDALGRPDLAKKCWEKALSIDPGFSPALNNLSTYFSHTGAHIQSIETVKRAIEQDPQVAVYHFNLSLYYLLFRYEVAREYGWDLKDIFRKIVEEGVKARDLEPDNSKFASHVAEVYQFARFFGVEPSWNRVAEEWKKALRSARTPTQKCYVYTNLGRVYLRAGNKDLAREYFLKAENVYPSPAARMWLEKLSKDGKTQDPSTR